MSCRSPRTRLSLFGAALVLAVVSACSSAPGDDSSQPEGEASQVSKSSEAKISSNIRPRRQERGHRAQAQAPRRVGHLRDGPGDRPQGRRHRRAGCPRTRPAGSPSPSCRRPRATASPARRWTPTSLKDSFESAFRTRKLSLDEQTYPSFVPTSGQTVGVGMPVVIRFDVPVSNKASIEKHLKVTSQPAQAGAFHWISNQEVHWRPRNYWRPGTDVTVKADIGGVPAGNGIYGQLDRTQRVPRRRRDGQQGRHEQPPDAGLPQRQAGPDHPDHDRRAAEVHHPVRHQGHQSRSTGPSG